MQGLGRRSCLAESFFFSSFRDVGVLVFLLGFSIYAFVSIFSCSI